MTLIDPGVIAELEKLESEATVGPWSMSGGSHVDGGVKLQWRSAGPIDVRTNFPSGTPEGDAANADQEFIAAARNYMRALLDERERLIEALAKSFPAKGFGSMVCTHCNQWHAPDCIWIAAREALR